MFGDVSGKLRISAIWPADHTDLLITYHAPQYAKLLHDLTPDAALKRLGLLVTLCPLSQKWVAAKALHLDFEPTQTQLRQEWLNADLWFFLQMAQTTPYLLSLLPLMMPLKMVDDHAWQCALGVSLTQTDALLTDEGWQDWCLQSEGILAKIIRYFSEPHWRHLWGNEITERLRFRCQRLIRLLHNQWHFEAPSHDDGWWQGAVPRGVVKHRVRVDRALNKITKFEVKTPTDARWLHLDRMALAVNGKASQEEWMNFIQALDPSVPLEWGNDLEGQ